MPISPRRCIAALFLLGEGALLFRIITLHLMGAAGDSAELKFSAVALCLTAALLFARLGGDWYLPAAMVLTLGADVFLVLLGKHLLVGVLLFFGVQTIYMLRLGWETGIRVSAAPRLLLGGGLALGLAAAGRLDWLTGAACFYLAHFFINLLLSLRGKTKAERVFALGLALFFCCDLCVGLSNGGLRLGTRLEEALRLAVWLYYLPGLALLVLAGGMGGTLRGPRLERVKHL